MKFIPPTRLFGLKRILLKLCGATIDKNVRIVSSARFHLTGPLSIDKETWIGHEALIIGGNAPVKIGRNVAIGPRAMLVTGSHQLWDNPNQAAGEGKSLPITIEEGVWIGATSTILGNVTIGKGAMIGAGALVNHDVLPGTAVGGVPAREINTSSSKTE